jgi:hypothetical protein
MRGGHERRRLLVTGDDEFDAGLSQRFDQVEILLARNAKYAIDSFILQRFDK